MGKIFYQPWVGRNYYKGFKGEKIIIVGTNHFYENSILLRKNYVFEDLSALSSKLITYRKKSCKKDLVDSLTHLEQIILKKENPQKEEIIELWDSIIFYNFCQKETEEFNDKPPTLEILNESLDAFIQIIEEYDPNIIITFSKYVRNFIISKLNCSEIQNIDDLSIYAMNCNNSNITFCYLNNHLKDLNWQEKSKLITLASKL